MKKIVQIALMAALMAICSYITIPMAVPFTMQTFAVFTAVGLLGWRNGLTSILVYIAMGAVGLPVFAGFSGGFQVILGPTGGYIVGFVLTALVMGALEKPLKEVKIGRILSMIAGLVACYAFGTAWFLWVYTQNTGAIGLWTALTWCVLPFIIPDLVKIVLADTLVKRLKRHVS